MPASEPFKPKSLVSSRGLLTFSAVVIVSQSLRYTPRLRLP